MSAKRCSIDGHQGGVFSKDKVTQITRVSVSRVEAAVTREGRHLPVPASSAKMEGLGGTDTACLLGRGLSALLLCLQSPVPKSDGTCDMLT